MKSKHITALLFCATLVSGGIIAVSGGRALPQEKPPAGASRQISIDNFNFGPADLTVPAGTTVTWTNKDDVPHTVVSDDKVFASPVLDTDQSFSFTFKNPGVFPYYCSIHPKMTAKIVVK